uniref:ULP_PROTEASE domain-containing protein n=1 Tax=Ascaris lumbricoides TaxID=6252 RepID=A0A0M3IKJ0_ASCLU
MDDVTEGFPFDDRKEDLIKDSSKSKRRVLRNAKNDFTIVKTINAKNIKSIEDKKGDAATEDLSPGVVYSMNRRERWNRLSADSVLIDAATKNISVGVLERWNTGKEGDQLASAYHRVSDGCITTRKAHHLSANANTLVEKPRPKHRGSRAKRELAAAVEAGLVDEQNEIPDVTYSISRTHPSIMKWKIVSNKGPKVTTKKRMKPIYESVDEEDEDVSESDVEDENNENEMQRERIRSYDISEFVHQPHSCAVFIEAPSIESLQSTVTSANTLVEKPRPKHRGSRAKRELAAAVEAGLVDEQNEIPDVTYSISRTHPSIMKWKIVNNKGPKVTTKKRMKPIYDSVDEEDEDVSESDVEEENIENEMQRERIRSYDISEFVHQPHSCAVFIEAPSIESLQSTVTSSSAVAPFELVTFPKEVREKSLVLRMLVKLNKWSNFDFAREAKELAISGQYSFTWLTHNGGSFAIDLTAAIVGHSQLVPHLIATFERPIDNSMSIRLNGGFSLEIPRRQVIAKLLNSEARSLTSMIESIVTCATNWRDREFYRSLETFAMPALKRKDLIEITEPFPYSRMYQSEMLLGALNIIPLEKMVAVVCEEHEASRTKENFEAIGTTYMCIKKRNKEEIRSCPLCLEAGVVSSGPCSSLCCSSCATCFCVECEGIPHWPLTCGQFEEWTEKFDPQYQWEIYRLDGKLKEHLITRKCHCGVLTELPDNIGIAKCSACWLTYYWDTGKTNLLYTTCYYGKDEHGNPIYKPPEAEMVSKRKAPTLVNRLYAPQCALARRKRFDVPEMKSMVAALKHQPSSFHQLVSATKLADLRNTVTDLIVRM